MFSFILYNVTVHEVAYMPTMYTKLFRFLHPSILEILSSIDSKLSLRFIASVNSKLKYDENVV